MIIVRHFLDRNYVAAQDAYRQMIGIDIHAGRQNGEFKWVEIQMRLKELMTKCQYFFPVHEENPPCAFRFYSSRQSASCAEVLLCQVKRGYI
jgi:hypothetical protein